MADMKGHSEPQTDGQTSRRLRWSRLLLERLRYPSLVMRVMATPALVRLPLRNMKLRAPIVRRLSFDVDRTSPTWQHQREHTGTKHNNQRDSEVVFWPSVFWRPGVPRPTNHTFSRNEWLFGFAAEAGKAKKAFVSAKLALVPHASEKPLGQKNTSASF